MQQLHECKKLCDNYTTPTPYKTMWEPCENYVHKYAKLREDYAPENYVNTM